jgi:predicted nucleotidyltransferase
MRSQAFGDVFRDERDMSSLKENLEQFVQRLQAAAGANVESVILYGSAARGDFHERYSDVNLLVVLREIGAATLGQLTPVFDWWTKQQKQRPPLVVTEQELRASADVFAIETLDVKANHRVLAGRDVMVSIDVPMNLHRVQLEHELRTTLLKLRQFYLLARGNEQRLQDAVAKSSSSVITLFRHALITMGRPAPHSRREVVAAIAEVEGINATALNAALDLREGRRAEAGIETLYHQYMAAIAELIHRIDQLAPKQQWQRTGVRPSPPSPERIG